MRKLLPIVLAFIGLGAGAAAGHFLRPAGDALAADSGELAGGHGSSASDVASVTPAQVEYVRLDKQFIVPLARDDRIVGMVLMTLAIEADPGSSDLVFQREPKLRDLFLQAMFLHAQSGGFAGAFTASSPMADLRGALRKAARDVIGPAAHDVLVTEIARQDL